MSGHPPMVKICGLQRAQDAALADELGTDYLGVIISAGFSRSVSGPVAAQILSGTSARRVAVVVDESAEDALALAESIEADVLQLHGTESPEMLTDLAARWSGLIWKAVRAGALADLQDVVSTHKDVVDGFLVEGWKDGVVGGGGVQLTLLPAEVRRMLPNHNRFVLAGGLNPDNVAEAAARFLPNVVDVSSGVEVEPGAKDPECLRRFFDEARKISSFEEHP